MRILNGRPEPILADNERHLLYSEIPHGNGRCIEADHDVRASQVISALKWRAIVLHSHCLHSLGLRGREAVKGNAELVQGFEHKP